MKAPKKPATIYRWVQDPTEACQGQARGRAARAAEAEPIPGRISLPAAGARRETGRLIVYEKRGSLGVITAKVQNVGDVYDEIDALLDEIERDEDVRTISIYTLNGLFASLPIR
jgi:hypothetical protein